MSYKLIENPQDGERVQYVGTYVLKWPFDVLGPPKVAFVEEEKEEDPPVTSKELLALQYLEHLTPGGSEFSSNPERCFLWINERMGTAARFKAQRDEAIQVLKGITHYIQVLRKAGVPDSLWQEELKTGKGMIVVSKEDLEKAIELVDKYG